MSSCLRMPPAPGHVELLGDLGQLGDAHVLERAELDDRGLGRGRGRGRRRRCRRLRFCRRGRVLGSVPSRSLRVPGESCYRSPQFIHSFAARRRYWQRGRSKRCFECLEILRALAARQLVDLCRDDVVPDARSVQPSGRRACRSRVQGGANRPAAGSPTRSRERGIREVRLGDAGQFRAPRRRRRARSRSPADPRGRRATAPGLLARPPS